MRIGIFDSGLGGLIILKKIVEKLPQYDYLYLGDTKRVPYGNRSQKTIYELTREAVDYLFKKNCQLIILACNSASSQALRKIQKEYLPRHYPSRRVLGVIRPTVEAVAQNKHAKALTNRHTRIDNTIKRVGVLATSSTIDSSVFVKEIKKLNPKIKVFQQAAPLLVPLVENDGLKWSEPIIKNYLKPLLNKKVDAIILGCTHYPILKNKIRKLIGRNTEVVSQDEIIPLKLKDYLKRHPETEKRLSKIKGRIFEVTDITDNFKKIAKKWFGRNIQLKEVEIL